MITRKNKPKGHWQKKENIFDEAKKYRSRHEFVKKASGAYYRALEFGILEDVCSHMVPGKNPNGYWSDNPARAIELAKTYKRKSHFQRKASAAYYSIAAHGLEKIAYAHMTGGRNIRPKGLYVYIFIHKKTGMGYFYVGVTDDFHRRKGEHRREDLSDYFNEKIYCFEEYQTKLNLNAEETRKMEAIWLRGKSKSKLSKRCFKQFNLINESKRLSLGGYSIIWTDEKIRSHCIAWGNKNRTEFCKKNKGCYLAAVKLGIWKEVSAGMSIMKYGKHYWTFEKALAEAKKFKTRTEFSKGSKAYQYAIRVGILDEICEHMKRL